MSSTTGPPWNREVREPVGIDVADADAGSAAEVRVVDPEEIGPDGRCGADERVDGDPRTASLIGREDEFGPAVVVEIGDGDEPAAVERLAADERRGRRNEHRDIIRTADDGEANRRSRASDEHGIFEAIAVHVSDGRANVHAEAAEHGRENDRSAESARGIRREHRGAGVERAADGERRQRNSL